MKTNANHLPDKKIFELAKLTSITLEMFPKGVEMIILFGSYARGNYVEEVDQDTGHFVYQSDFDILVVVDTKKREEQLNKWYALEERFAQSPEISTPVTLISHDIKYINSNLSDGQYFFKDIKNEGICLYDSKRFKLVEPRHLTPEEYKKQAEDYFEQFYDSGKVFYRQFEHALCDKNYKIAAFELHQATECFYSVILLVFSLYKPKVHDIGKLFCLAVRYEPDLFKIFPKGTKEERRKFKLLLKAYVDARYKKDYTVTRKELEWLAGEVKQLQIVTSRSCTKRIGSIVVKKQKPRKTP